MASRDLFNQPFPGETITKLEIFQYYLEAWLPTFIMQDERNLYIYDFFSGMGYDKNMVPGSPIRILESILKFQGHILKKKTKINILLNEFDKKKFDALKKNVEDFLEENKKMRYYVNIEFYNEKFEHLYPEKKDELAFGPNLIFIDQYGIKQFTDSIFKEFLEFERTDFLVFISSSAFRRFAHTEEFSQHVNIDVDAVQKAQYEYIHKVVLEHYKKMIPEDNETRLYPFSIRKNRNIYGLIFGAKHVAAVDKFLKITWKKNVTNGSANFDIDKDISPKEIQISLFAENIIQKKSKIQKFEEELENYILNSGRNITNIDVYLFAISKAFTSEHAATVVRRLKGNKIDYKGHPLVNYENYRKMNEIIYERIQ